MQLSRMRVRVSSEQHTFGVLERMEVDGLDVVDKSRYFGASFRFLASRSLIFLSLLSESNFLRTEIG